MTHILPFAADPLFVRIGDPRLVSYNIEMTEVTGGTFWKAYTPAQIAGKEPFRVSELSGDFTALKDLMQAYPPADLSRPRLREAANALGPAWIRVSGSWATKTYYDFDGSTGGIPPKGYASVLTAEQWKGVLDFVSAVKGKLLISVSNCAGDHPNGGPLDLTQTKKIFDFSHAYGVEIAAAEFMNEPNPAEMSGAPKGYSAKDFGRDQDLFFAWIRKHYPDCLTVGPCALGELLPGKGDGEEGLGKLGENMPYFSTEELLSHATLAPDIFSYHCYNGVSERLASIFPAGYWNEEEILSREYLSVAEKHLNAYLPLRDRFAPAAPLWVTESGDAGGGGTTRASTFADVFRTLWELGTFSLCTEGVIFHNTLASSDYGWLDRTTLAARPNYYAVLLWNRLMGSTVYKVSVKNASPCALFCHSPKDGKEGFAYLLLNPDREKGFFAELPAEGEIYQLTAPHLRAEEMHLNGVPLSPRGPLTVPAPKRGKAVGIPPLSCTFLKI